MFWRENAAFLMKAAAADPRCWLKAFWQISRMLLTFCVKKSRSVSYKYCTVPCCTKSTANTPEKHILLFWRITLEENCRFVVELCFSMLTKGLFETVLYIFDLIMESFQSIHIYIDIKKWMFLENGWFICVLSATGLIRHASKYAKETITKSFQKFVFNECKVTETNWDDGNFSGPFVKFLKLLLSVGTGNTDVQQNYLTKKMAKRKNKLWKSKKSIL